MYINRFSIALSMALAASACFAQEDRFAAVEITDQHINGPIHMLMGAGGNIGVSIGDDGTLIIDDQYAPLAERIQAALRRLGGNRPELILNTHLHGDHTGGNAFFGDDGVIVAHANVRSRLLAQGDLPNAALPAVTFADTLTVHFNGDDIQVIHLPHGHTDGDSVVLFTNSNVLHMGDLFFNGSFPFVDMASGGTVTGYMDDQRQILARIPSDIAIIPGHGPMATKQDLALALSMIETTHSMVNRAMDAGSSVDEVIAQGLGEDYKSWGAGFINEERWIRTLAADRQAAQ
ncbi:MAG: MBL fold metallo-hydrolase [Proteobacteria bacterium]|nr:MBL fold metallo-hydrolase [Pseudomonadota bacterium]